MNQHHQEMLAVVPETKEHIEPIRDLTVAAFAASEFGHNGESDLIDVIRKNCDEYISLVALDTDYVVGHIMFTPASIQFKNQTLNGWGLAPLSVDPAHQSRGIGSLLVGEGLKRVANTKTDFTIVAGHPKFYARLGFVAAKQFSISHGLEGMPQDVFYIHFHNEAVIRGASGGLAYYHPVFGVQHKDQNASGEGS